MSFLNYELKLINKKSLDKKNVIDTLELARAKFPGSQNSLDALCKRFNIDNSKREKHSAIIDCHLLKEVYVNLLDQKAPKLNLESEGEILNSSSNNPKSLDRKVSGKIIKPSQEELEFHKKYLKNDLQKNYY